MEVRDMSSLMFQKKVARSYQMLHDASWKSQKKQYEKHHNTADGHIRIWLGIRQIMNSTDHLLTETRDTVKELKTRIHMGKDKTTGKRRITICIFDDVAEQCHEAALKYYDTYLPFLLEACNDMNPDVRQAAVYGLGVCAEFGGFVFEPLVLEALSTLNVVIRDPNALQPKNIMACDNPISAMGKICQFHRESIDSAQTRNAIVLVALVIAAGLGALTYTLSTLVLVIGASGFAIITAVTAIRTVVGIFR